MAIDFYNDPHAEKRGHILHRARINPAAPPKETVKPGKALYLTADAKVVEEGHPDAEMVLVGEDGVLPKDLADELGIKPHKAHKSRKKEADEEDDTDKSEEDKDEFDDEKDKEEKPKKRRGGLTIENQFPTEQTVTMGHGDRDKGKE